MKYVLDLILSFFLSQIYVVPEEYVLAADSVQTGSDGTKDDSASYEPEDASLLPPKTLQVAAPVVMDELD